MSIEERLPEGWISITLGMLGEYINGYAFNDELWSKNGRPIIRIQDLTGTRNSPNYYDGELEEKYLVRTGDLLIAWSATLGAYIWRGPEAWLNQHIFKVVSYIDKSFHYYLAQSVISELYQNAHGSGMVHVTRGIFEATKVPLPPLPEQSRIVAVIEQQFTRLDSAVASLQSAKARVKQYRVALLKAAFEGELTKEWRAEHPVEETGAQLLMSILAERHTRWEEEQLTRMRERGIMPKDDKWKQAYKEPQEPDVENLPALLEAWCWATVEQVAQIQGGIQKQPSRVPRQNAYPYLRVANVLRGRLDLSVIEKMELFGNELETLHLKSGDLLIVEGNGSKTEIGRSALWNDEIENCVHQNHIIRVRLNHVLPKFIDFYWNSAEGNQRVMDVAASTTGLYTLSVSKISRLPVPLPPLAEQAHIVAEVEARLSDIAKLEEAIENNLKRSEHERQSILREAFVGRLVSQDPDDEPVSMLLERIREERKKREEMENIVRVNRKGIQMASTNRRRAGNTSLYTVLVKAGHPIPPDELFKGTNLKIDEQPESVEVFYEELHADVENALVAETRPDYEHVLLEALEPSAEVLGRIAEEEAVRQAQEAQQSGKTIDAPMLWNMEPPREPRTGGM